jgi:hypothetical protein
MIKTAKNEADEDRDLLRIFKYIDSLPFYQKPGCICLYENDIVIDGKTARELNPKIAKLPQKGVVTITGPHYTTTGEAFLIIEMNTLLAVRWRAIVASDLENT